jgi:hypothetical protein
MSGRTIDRWPACVFAPSRTSKPACRGAVHARVHREPSFLQVDVFPAQAQQLAAAQASR